MYVLARSVKVNWIMLMNTVLSQCPASVGDKQGGKTRKEVLLATCEYEAVCD
jgi:hypothetical protein